MKALLFLAAISSISPGSCDCPMGSVKGVGKECYQFKLRPMQCRDALADCEQLGGTLTSVHSTIVNHFLASQMGGGWFTQFWLGGSNEMHQRWSWTDGTPFSFTNWARGVQHFILSRRKRTFRTTSVVAASLYGIRHRLVTVVQ